MALIEAENLRKVFRGPKGRQIEAVCGASLAIDRGEILGLLGPNGAGKTTLLRMLGTIISPSSGEVRINGKPASAAPEAARRNIGFLSGNTKLYGRLTGRELLKYFGRLYGMDHSAIVARTEALADLLDMRAFVDRRCETLSTGQAQKVSISRVILHDPPVLILDEPTLGLDIMTSRVIVDFIRGARERGHAIIFSTHYMAEAETLCDRIALIHRGALLSVAPIAELYRRTSTAHLQDAFLALVAAAGETAA
jgi:sodium transport system ATP-binding protein